MSPATAPCSSPRAPPFPPSVDAEHITVAGDLRGEVRCRGRLQILPSGTRSGQGLDGDAGDSGGRFLRRSARNGRHRQSPTPKPLRARAAPGPPVESRGGVGRPSIWQQHDIHPPSRQPGSALGVVRTGRTSRPALTRNRKPTVRLDRRERFATLPRGVQSPPVMAGSQAAGSRTARIRGQPSANHDAASLRNLPVLRTVRHVAPGMVPQPAALRSSGKPPGRRRDARLRDRPHRGAYWQGSGRSSMR